MTVLSEETAKEQIAALLDYYDFAVDDLPPNLRPGMEAALRQLERAVMKGTLEVEVTDDDCTVHHHLKRPPKGMSNPVVYHQVTGECKVAIRDDDASYAKTYTFLAALSREERKFFLEMKGKDLSISESLGALFLQV